MRALLIIFLIVVAVGVASPFFVGSKVESSLQDQLAQLDALPVYMVKVDSYERGYRSSQAVVSVGFEEEIVENMSDNSGAMEADVLENVFGGFKIYFDIQHGPLLTQNGFSLGWTDIETSFDRETYPELEEVFDGLETDVLLSWKMHVGLTGAGWMESDVPDIDVSIDEEGEQFHIVMKGYEDFSTFTNYGESISSDGNIDEITLNVNSEEAFSVTLKDMRYDAEFTYLDVIWMGLGEMEAGIGSFVIDADELDVTMDDVVLHAAMSEGSSPETMTVRESIRMSSGVFNGYQVESAEFAFSYKNISKALFEAYMDSYDIMLSADPSSDEVSAELKEKFEPVLKEALTYSPGLDLESVAFQSDDGSMKASASFDIDSALLGADIDFDNPFTLIPALNVLADVEISESLVKKIMVMRTKNELAAFSEVPDEAQLEEMVDMQIAMMAGPLEQQGYIKKEGENYSASFSFSNGTAAVNGLPVPIPGLF